MTFKFHFVQNGNAKGFLASKGALEENGLRLGEDFLPFASVADTTTRDHRLVLVPDQSAGPLSDGLQKHLDSGFLILHVNGGKAASLEKEIDRHASAHEAEAHRQQLSAEGRGHLFRTAICPHCSATVDVSELPETPYCYCRYCESLFGSAVQKVKSSNRYRQCDECGYYDRVQGYGEFYFYFLLVIYGFSHRRRHMCDHCGATLSNKLLAVNAIFLLGVPNAVACAVRARVGRDQELGGLTTANKLAKKGKMAQAQVEYQKVLSRLDHHPGVYLNMARGHFIAQNNNEGFHYLDLALDNCPNFGPALALAHRLSPGQ